jgi:chemotaxis protein methyltransferase CheR
MERHKTRGTSQHSAIDRLADHIHSHWGLVVQGRRKDMLQHRLRQRVRTLGLADFDAYLSYLWEGGGFASEQLVIIDAVTTRTTAFFREHEHYDFFADVIAPELKESGALAQRGAKLWSAACSTGQEAYSMAMACELCGDDLGHFPYQVEATDLALEALRRTRNGVYREADLEKLSTPVRRRFFLQSKDRTKSRVRVIPALRRKVNVSKLNLINRSYEMPRDFDVIMLRNCLIYFDRITQVRVARQIADHLRPGGYLMTGHTEHFIGEDIGLKVVRPSIYRKDED